MVAKNQSARSQHTEWAITTEETLIMAFLTAKEAPNNKFKKTVAKK